MIDMLTCFWLPLTSLFAQLLISYFFFCSCLLESESRPDGWLSIFVDIASSTISVICCSNLLSSFSLSSHYSMHSEPTEKHIIFFQYFSILLNTNNNITKQSIMVSSAVWIWKKRVETCREWATLKNLIFAFFFSLLSPNGFDLVKHARNQKTQLIGRGRWCMQNLRYRCWGELIEPAFQVDLTHVQ